MLVRSDELGDELEQTRALLFRSIHGGERLGRLAGRFCRPRDLKDSVRGAIAGRSLMKAERANKDSTLVRA